MDKKQYNNIIDWTLNNEEQAQCEDSLTVARAVCTNLGVALPQGDLAQVAEVLATDDYMGWKASTKEEAQEDANNGIPAIGVSNDQIVVLAADDEEQPVANAVAVMTLANDADTMDDSVAYYSYSCCTTCVEDNPESAINEIPIFLFNNVMRVNEHRNFQVLVKLEKPPASGLVWNSSDSNVVAITDAGEAWARAVGKVQLSVRTVDGQYQGTIDVEVVVDYVTIQKDGDYSKVVFNNGTTWECDSFHYDNRLEHNVPDHYDRATHNASIDFSIKQLGFLFRIDPNGVIHYVKHKQLSGDTTPTDYLIYRDDIFKEIYGRMPRYFNYVDSHVYYRTGINESNRYNVYSEAELIFGMLPRWNWKSILAVVIQTVISLVPVLGEIQMTYNLVTALYFTGAIEGPINDAANEFLNTVWEANYGEKAVKRLSWAMTIVNLIPSLLETAVPPDIDAAQLAIYESAYQNDSYAILIAGSDQLVNLSAFVEHHKKLLAE